MSEAKQFRKKPVVISAMYFDPFQTGITSCEEICNWIIKGGGDADFSTNERCIYIFTLEGKMKALPGDYIIRGIKGEHYPCKPEIFAATYEPL